jgi:hypothetical protein
MPKLTDAQKNQRLENQIVYMKTLIRECELNLISAHSKFNHGNLGTVDEVQKRITTIQRHVGMLRTATQKLNKVHGTGTACSECGQFVYPS